MGYETEKWREPTIQEGDKVIFSEHGRSVNNVDFKSHWLVLVQAQYGGYFLLVKHGGGEERISLGYEHHTASLKTLELVPEDQRYLILYTIYRAHSNAEDNAITNTATKYKLAFLEKRLKRRRKNNRLYVDIIPRVVPAVTVKA